MAPEATPQRSAASMSYANYGSGGASADRVERLQITREAQRAVAGPAVVNFYARLNPAINPAKTHLNIDMVNAGDGTFRRTRSIGEVTAYGDERVERLRPGLKDGNRHMVTVVGHLPWAYCEPDGTEYQVLDKSGQPRFLPGGAPMMQPRYKVKAGCEEIAERYFQDWIANQEGLIPGGQAAIHGYSIQFDEGRPHIQLQADPYEPNPSKKHPDALKNGYSRVYGSHPKDGMVPVLDHGGNPVVVDGKTKMVREGPRRKMERYQAEHRAYMVERGYEVDPERDAERHDRTLSLADYKDVQHQRAEVQVRQADLGAALADAESDQLDVAAVVDQIEAEKFSEFAEARSSGYTAGVTAGAQAGREQTQAELDAAAAQLAAAEAERAAAAEKTAAAEEARQVAAAHEAAQAEAKEKAEAEAAAAAEARQAADSERQAVETERQAAEQARAEIEGRLDAIPVYDPAEAEKHSPAELIRHLKKMRDADSGEPVLTKAHRLGVQNHETEAKRQGVDQKTFLTETVAERNARVGARGVKLAETSGQQQKKKPQSPVQT